MNKIIILGRITDKPEVKSTEAYTRAIFTIAEGVGEKVNFIKCKAFGKTAEFMEKWIKKGERIFIAGHIQTGTYADEDGKNRYFCDVIADQVEFADGKKEED